MLVIVNPYATTVSDRLKNLVVYALQGRYEVDAMDTEGRDHATILCREAAQEGYDVVVAFGGDGTVNEAANGLAHSPTPLTPLPGGATNVYCKMLGVPSDIVDATEHLLRLADDWMPRRVDLAHVNGRGFTFSAGFGLDASVVRRVDAHPALKARLKQWYFAYAAVATFSQGVRRAPAAPGGARRRRGPARRHRCACRTATPTPTSAVGRSISPKGLALDDGQYGGVMLERASPVDIPTVSARLLSDRLRLADHKRISAFTTSDEVRIVSADGRPVALQVDGDYIGDTAEAVFGVWPGALSVVA